MKKQFTYGSVCSGIEAATVAWKPLGWKPLFFSEKEPFPRAVLAHHYPGVPIEGDFRNIQTKDYEQPDLLVGGTPCQSFSYTGQRQGLVDPRGNLALEFFRLAARLRARWVIWENVPGTLSVNKGQDFEEILGEVAQCGYGFAWRILDAQRFGVPQSRRRIFLVAHSSADWQYPAAVLFDSEELFDHPPKNQNQTIANARKDGRFVGKDSAGKEVISTSGPVSYCLHTEARWLNPTYDTYILYPRKSLGRSLAIEEAEQLQGLPINYTRIPWRGKPAEKCPSTYRHEAVGNSMPVPVMRWLGMRIELLENHLNHSK